MRNTYNLGSTPLGTLRVGHQVLRPDTEKLLPVAMVGLVIRVHDEDFLAMAHQMQHQTMQITQVEHLQKVVYCNRTPDSLRVSSKYSAYLQHIGSKLSRACPKETAKFLRQRVERENITNPEGVLIEGAESGPVYVGIMYPSRRYVDMVRKPIRNPRSLQVGRRQLAVFPLVEMNPCF